MGDSRGAAPPLSAEPPHNELPRRTRLILFALLVPAYWAACFAPFDFVAPVSFRANDAHRQPAPVDGPASLQFPEWGIAESALRWPAQASAVRIRLRASSAVPDQSGPARILSLAPDTLSRNLTLGQNGADLVLRLRRAGSNDNGTPDLVVSDVFSTAQPHAIELLLQGASAELRVNGQLRLQVPAPSVPLTAFAADFPLQLGNEASFDRPWRGTIHALDIVIDGAPFADLSDFELPRGHWLPSARASRFGRYSWIPFSGWNELLPLDIIANILGFLPFGMLLTWRRVRVHLLWCVAAAAALSLSIELGQIAFAGRHPAGNDLVMNTLGGMLGALIGRELK